MKKIPIGLLLLTVLLSAYLYAGSFTAYFFQDDWFSLRISHAQSVNDILAFFRPRTDVIYYRPLGMQLPYFVLQRLFGVQPLAFHGVTFLVHTINIAFVYLLLRRLKITDVWAAFGAFLYGVSTVHYLPMYWTATFAFVAGPTLVFGSFLTFISFLSGGKVSSYLWSLIVFLLGVFTNEMTVVLPMILGLYGLYQREPVRRILLLVPYVLCAGVLLLLRFVIYPPPLTGSYSQAIGISTIHNLKGYLLWSLQWPEEITAQFVSFFRLNSQFAEEFRPFLMTEMVVTSIFSLVSLWALGMVLRRSGWRSVAAVISFAGLWFIVGLLPVLFFVGHSFSYYLPVSLVGGLFLFVSLLQRSTVKYPRARLWLIGGLGGLWFWAALTTVSFNDAIHWAPRRAILSKNMVEKALITYPPERVKLDPVIYVRPSAEEKHALNNQDAFIVIYGISNLQTIYGSEVNQEVL